MSERPLSQIVAAVEAGQSLAPDEVALVTRLAAQIPPRPANSFLDERDDLIRSIVDDFGPSNAESVSRRAAWLEERYERLVTGADWRRDRHTVLCPYADPLRSQLWRLAQFGPLPRDRKLREIIGGT